MPQVTLREITIQLFITYQEINENENITHYTVAHRSTTDPDLSRVCVWCQILFWLQTRCV